MTLVEHYFRWRFRGGHGPDVVHGVHHVGAATDGYCENQQDKSQRKSIHGDNVQVGDRRQTRMCSRSRVRCDDANDSEFRRPTDRSLTAVVSRVAARNARPDRFYATESRSYSSLGPFVRATWLSVNGPDRSFFFFFFMRFSAPTWCLSDEQ